MSRPWSSLVAGALAGIVLTLTAAAPAVASTEPVPAPSRDRVVAEVLPAVTYLEIRSIAFVREKATGRLIAPITQTSTCSGVVIGGDGHVATAGHCVHPDDIADGMAGRTADILVARGLGPKELIMGFIRSRYEFGGIVRGTPMTQTVTVVRADAAGAEQRMRARVVDALPNARGDVALVDVDATDLPTAALATAGDPTPGTPVTAVGYPADRDRVVDPSREPSWKDGTVSSVQRRDGVPFVEVSASMAPGMSGGPTVDGQGRVVGINSMGLSGGGAFNFLTPTSALRGMLERHGVDTAPGPVDVAYRRGLDHLAAGENADAVADFTAVTERRGDHGQALARLADAREAYARDGDASERAAALWTTVGVGAAALLVVGGGMALVVRRRRRAATTPPPAAFAPGPWGPGPWGPVPPGAQQGPWTPPQGPWTPPQGTPTGPWGPQYGPATLPADHPSGPLPAVPAEPTPEQHHR